MSVRTFPRPGVTVRTTRPRRRGTRRAVRRTVQLFIPSLVQRAIPELYKVYPIMKSACFPAMALAAGLAFPCLAAVASTQDAEPRWTAGLGVVVNSNPYRGADDDVEATAIPYIAYENDWLSVSPEGAAVAFYRGEAFRLEALVAPRWQFAEPGDVSGLEDIERDIAVDGGFRVSAASGPVTVSLAYLADLSGKHEGQEATLSVAAETALTSRFAISAEAGACWRDSDLGTYMYGIYADEVRPGRAAYSADDSVAPFMAAMGRYALTERVAIVGAIEVEAIPDTGRDSPIIDADARYGAFLGLMVRF